MHEETIALDQLAKDAAAPESLLVLPDGAPHTASAKPGITLALAGDHLIVTATVEVELKYQPGKYRGMVVVARPHDLHDAIAKLATAGVNGRLELGGKSIAIGTPQAGAAEHDMPLPSQPELHVVVAMAAAAPAAFPMPLVAGGGAAGLVGLVLVVAGLLRRSPAAAPLAAAPTQGTFTGPGTTQLSGGQVSVAAGTPGPVDSQPGMPVSSRGITPGAMIGRWEVVRQLGSGGMADVFLARAKGEAGFEKLVAIKVMHPHLARNSRAVQLFLDEARLAARITHGNVVAIQDLGKIGDDYVIVMEYVDGVDLERLLMAGRAADRPVPIDVALGILCRVCDGLNAAHKATAADGSPLQIVHRDVKSANVLVSKQGGVKVVDFGIAKAATQSHYTVAGETKGTPSMMAPEQRVGEQVDARADVYAVAAVAYEVLTGHGVNLDLAVLAHLGVENWPHLPPLTEMRPQLPPELDRIVLGAMAYDREGRPADCAALETELANVMKQHGLVASDKDIGRWVTAELTRLPVAPGASAAINVATGV
jgi:hypothetical protein